MNEFDDGFSRTYFDHDSAIVEALVKTEKGLFDVEYSYDEDLDALKSN